MHAIATGSCLMIPSMIPDGPKPVPTSSDFAIIRRGRPGDVAVSVPAVTEKLGAPGRIGGGMFIHTSLFGDDFTVWGDAIVDHSGPVHSM